MDVVDAGILAWAMPKLEAHEILVQLKIQDWNIMKQDAREKYHAKMREVAYAGFGGAPNRKAISNKDLFEILMRR